MERTMGGKLERYLAITQTLAIVQLQLARGEQCSSGQVVIPKEFKLGAISKTV